MSKAEAKVKVVGAEEPYPPPPDGGLSPRLNITTLIKNEKQWALYIQALSECNDPFRVSALLMATVQFS